jgi:hypothetical protein
MMTKSLSFLKLQALILLLGLFTASCSEDDAEEELAPSVTNSVAYNGQTYEIKNGLILNYGSNASHYNNDIIVSDGTFSMEETENGTFALYLELYSAGTSGFQPGTFQFAEEDDDVAESTSFFTANSGLIIETNADGVVDDGDEVIHITAGTVTVSGSGTDYTLVYDVTLENGKTLKGGYAGSSTSIDRTEDDNDDNEEEDESEEEPVAPLSYFMLDDQHHYFTQGVAHSIGIWENDSTGRFHEILLMDEGFQIDDEGNYTGEGLWLNLTLVAKEAGQIEEIIRGMQILVRRIRQVMLLILHGKA